MLMNKVRQYLELLFLLQSRSATIQEGYEEAEIPLALGDPVVECMPTKRSEVRML